jgi:hypothetical protein
MTERYTHFNVRDFQDVKMIQEQIFLVESKETGIERAS